MVVLTCTCIGAPPYRIGNSPNNTLMEAPHLRFLPKSINFLSDSATSACPMNTDSVVCDGGKDYEEAQTTFSERSPLVNGYPEVLKSGINGGDYKVVEEDSFSPCTRLDAEANRGNSLAIVGNASNQVAGACGSDLTPICTHAPVVAANRKPDLGKITKNSTMVSEHVPHWGCVSVCGRRPEMEDAATALLRFTQIPLQMLPSEKASGSSSVDQRSGCESVHFFGVYDGHGGAQVANYCKERVHEALAEEVGNHVKSRGGGGGDMSQQWHRLFTNCFEKVDAEVGGERRGASDDGSVGQFEAIAPETVGSTAVIALVSSSHIIVANCGDSRAVLCRGKQPMPLSVDHKPDREDECARIEAAGGKVIQWNGYRVLGVLAMSRSIGDRYLKPWVISEPEVKCVSRVKEDECLILASDGLWDVLSNEEVCDVARKRILLWHKKNGGNSLQGRGGEGPDPAAVAAADYLTKLALHKGSKDNVSVIVIDLKEQRKFKTRT